MARILLVSPPKKTTTLRCCQGVVWGAEGELGRYVRSQKPPEEEAVGATCAPRRPSLPSGLRVAWRRWDRAARPVPPEADFCNPPGSSRPAGSEAASFPLPSHFAGPSCSSSLLCAQPLSTIRTSPMRPFHPPSQTPLSWSRLPPGPLPLDSPRFLFIPLFSLSFHFSPLRCHLPQLSGCCAPPLPGLQVWSLLWSTASVPGPESRCLGGILRRLGRVSGGDRSLGVC